MFTIDPGYYWQVGKIGQGIAILYGTLLAHLFVQWIVNLLHDNEKITKKGKLDLRKPKRDVFARVQSGILGVIERSLYIGTFTFSFLGFIPIWLILKTAVTWSQWKKKQGRRSFNTFLIGNGLNLTFSFAAYQMILSAATPESPSFGFDYILWFILPLLLSASILIWLWIKKGKIQKSFEELSIPSKSKIKSKKKSHE